MRTYNDIPMPLKTKDFFVLCSKCGHCTPLKLVDGDRTTITDEITRLSKKLDEIYALVDEDMKNTASNTAYAYGRGFIDREKAAEIVHEMHESVIGQIKAIIIREDK